MTIEELRDLHNGKPFSILIGIDVGVKTGFAVYETKSKSFSKIQTLKIHDAMDIVKKEFAINGQSLKVYF